VRASGRHGPTRTPKGTPAALLILGWPFVVFLLAVVLEALLARWLNEP
jgi:hypothetical protein